MNTLEPNALFDTPESTDAFVQWLDGFKDNEKMIALTAASMAWNLAAKIVNDKETTQ